MSTKTTFAILGSGMQGTSAAYDLARFGDPEAIVMGDVQLDQAQKACDRVNALVGRVVCLPKVVDAMSDASLSSFLSPVDVVVSCVPFWLNPRVAAAAVAAGASMVDLGGETEATLETLALDEQAKAAGVSLVPDTGLAPGLVSSLALAILESLDSVDSIQTYCGVLPQNPVPPFNYKLTFNVDGLVNEYDDQAVVLRDGEIVMVDTLTELETQDFKQVGPLEAFVTSGGTSTAPYTWQGRLRTFEYKTLRFPGHCDLIRIFKDFGFWSPHSVSMKGGEVAPRDVFCKVFGDALAKFEDRDQCFVRAVGIGQKDGHLQRIQIDIYDQEDPTTGFTSMERLTGWSAAIVAIEIARGGVPKGAVRYEDAMSGHRFIEELRQREIAIEIQSSPT